MKTLKLVVPIRKLWSVGLFLIAGCIMLPSYGASPSWMGVDCYHPWDGGWTGNTGWAKLKQLEPHWGRVAFNVDEISSNGWAFSDAAMAVQQQAGVSVIAVVSRQDEPICRQILDRYGSQIAIIEAGGNEPLDYPTLSNNVAIWRRVVRGRTYRPSLAAPSNCNSTDTFSLCQQLKADGLLGCLTYISCHDYLGHSGNGTAPKTNDTFYWHPDQDCNGYGTAFARYTKLSQTFGKKIIITEFAFEPTDPRDGAVWAATFTAANVKAVCLHWPHNDNPISGQWFNGQWSAAMVTFTNTAALLGAMRQ